MHDEKRTLLVVDLVRETKQQESYELRLIQRTLRCPVEVVPISLCLMVVGLTVLIAIPFGRQGELTNEVTYLKREVRQTGQRLTKLEGENEELESLTLHFKIDQGYTPAPVYRSSQTFPLAFPPYELLTVFDQSSCGTISYPSKPIRTRLMRREWLSEKLVPVSHPLLIDGWQFDELHYVSYSLHRVAKVEITGADGTSRLSFKPMYGEHYLITQVGVVLKVEVPNDRVWAERVAPPLPKAKKKNNASA